MISSVFQGRFCTSINFIKMNFFLGAAKHKQLRSQLFWQNNKHLVGSVSNNLLIIYNLFNKGPCILGGYERAHKCKRCGIKKHGVRSCKDKWRVGVGDLAMIKSCNSEIESIAAIAMDDFLLQNFFRTIFCFPALPRLNTITCFCLVDVLQLLYANFPSPLRPFAWAKLFLRYLDFLQVNLLIIICFGVKLGYKSPINVLILLKNLSSALVDTKINDNKLYNHLKL